MTHNTKARIRVFVPSDATPATHKGQLDAFFDLLGVKDFAAATAAITAFKSSAAGAQNWQADQKAFFDLVGATDQAGAIAAVTQLNNERDGLWKALGVTSYADAVAKIGTMNADLTARQATIDTLTTQTATLSADLGAARTKITDLEASQNDFNGRVDAEVTRRIASAGLPSPIAKVFDAQNSGPAPRKGSHLQRAIALVQQEKK